MVISMTPLKKKYLWLVFANKQKLYRRDFQNDIQSSSTVVLQLFFISPYSDVCNEQ